MPKIIRKTAIAFIGLLLTAIAYHYSVSSLIEYLIMGPLCERLISDWRCNFQLAKIHGMAVTPVKVFTLAFTGITGICVARLIVNKGWAY